MLDIVLFSFFFFSSYTHILRSVGIRRRFHYNVENVFKQKSKRENRERERNFGLSLLNCSVSIQGIANNDI